jgi:putative transposase
VFHVLNRGNDRREIFQAADDYAAFLRVVRETQDRCPMRILAYCLMPTHWHFLLWPERDGQLGAFMQRLTTTHVRRWHLHRHTVGRGHLYQGAYKSFPVQDDEHFYTVCRYVERNALRAQLVTRAEQWQWGSLTQRLERLRGEKLPVLAAWPVSRPRNWVALVDQPQTERELEAVRLSIQRGRPFGDESWLQRTAEQLRLESTLRPRGRPKKR